MESDELIDAVEREGRLLAEAAAPALDSLVVACPGWTVEAMVGHIGQIHRWVTHIVTNRATQPTREGRDAKAPPGRAVIDWYRDGHAALAEALRGIGPDDPVWTWTDRGVGGFYHRRMAHETAVHRWDAQRALRPPDPIDGRLAADGIDEVLEVGMRYSTSRPDRTYPAGSLHLHRTDGDGDGDGEWMITPGPDRSSFTVTAEHGKGDAAVRGTASDLVTYLWGRRPPGLEVFGDESLVAAWASMTP